MQKEMSSESTGQPLSHLRDTPAHTAESYTRLGTPAGWGDAGTEDMFFLRVGFHPKCSR